jgi:hypothetical protein
MNATVNTAADQGHSAPSLHLTVIVSEKFIPIFLGFVRSGFAADVTIGCSLQDLLSNQLGVDAKYLQDRVQTIFLNNSPVDDIAGTTVDDGATISLSAAMPGLNGAVMRKGGVLASLRQSITHHQDDECRAPQQGKIMLKLFNLIAKEIGPDFLARGILVKGRALAEVLAGQTRQFWQNVEGVEIDKVRCGAERLQSLDLSTREVFLQVRSAQKYGEGTAARD